MTILLLIFYVCMIPFAVAALMALLLLVAIVIVHTVGILDDSFGCHSHD